MGRVINYNRTIADMHTDMQVSALTNSTQTNWSRKHAIDVRTQARTMQAYARTRRQRTHEYKSARVQARRHVQARTKR